MKNYLDFANETFALMIIYQIFVHADSKEMQNLSIIQAITILSRNIFIIAAQFDKIAIVWMTNRYFKNAFLYLLLSIDTSHY